MGTLEQKEQLLPQLCTPGSHPNTKTLQGSCISAGSLEFCFWSPCMLVTELKLAYISLGESPLCKVESRQEPSVNMLNMVLVLPVLNSCSLYGSLCLFSSFILQNGKNVTFSLRISPIPVPDFYLHPI